MSETMTLDISLSQPQYEYLLRMAEEQNRPIADLLSHLIAQVLTTTQQDAEHHAVREARYKYPGQYVALYQGRILAHATDAATLLERVRRDFGLTNTDVVLVKAETSEALSVRHPQLVDAL
jgi:ABC-type amino acid transport substrate-binding protein